MGYSTHSICKYNLRLKPGQHRWWTAIRKVHEHNKKIAKKHLIDCKNEESDICICDS